MSSDGRKSCQLVRFGQEHLERMSRQQDKIEFAIQPQRSGITLKKLHLSATRPIARDIQHRRSRIDRRDV